MHQKIGDTAAFGFSLTNKGCVSLDCICDCMAAYGAKLARCISWFELRVRRLLVQQRYVTRMRCKAPHTASSLKDGAQTGVFLDSGV